MTKAAGFGRVKSGLCPLILKPVAFFGLFLWPDPAKGWVMMLNIVSCEQTALLVSCSCFSIIKYTFPKLEKTIDH